MKTNTVDGRVCHYRTQKNFKYLEKKIEARLPSSGSRGYSASEIHALSHRPVWEAQVLDVSDPVTSVLQSFPPQPGAPAQSRVSDQQTNLNKRQGFMLSDTQPQRMTEMVPKGK